jgi:hypothetical protein
MHMNGGVAAGSFRGIDPTTIKHSFEISATPIVSQAIV